MQKVRIAAVKYINTLPMLEGLQRSSLMDQVELYLDHPARCAAMLREGTVDLALCPVGALSDLDTYRIVTDFCIGCNGAVRTVGVYSHRPVAELKYIVLDAESRTSNLLAHMLEGQFWHFGLSFGYDVPLSLDPATVGYLCIGDKCFAMENEYDFSCDLGLAWKESTGLPFAFACWTSRKAVDPELEQQLNRAFASGIQAIASDTSRPPELRHYLTHNIDFDLDSHKRKAMQLFLNAVKTLPKLADYVAEDSL